MPLKRNPNGKQSLPTTADFVYKGYVTYPLSEEQVDEILAQVPTVLQLWDMLATLVDDKSKLSFEFDANEQIYQAKATQYAGLNAGTIVSASAESLSAALLALAYKIHGLGDGQWAVGSAAAKKGIR